MVKEKLTQGVLNLGGILFDIAIIYILLMVVSSGWFDLVILILGALWFIQKWGIMEQ